MRPACFIPTVPSLPKFESWCTDYDVALDSALYSEIRFWSFPYTYCDRSNWNTISADTRDFIDQTHNRGGIMARTVLQDTASSDDGHETASSDEEDIGNERDLGVDDD